MIYRDIISYVVQKSIGGFKGAATFSHPGVSCMSTGIWEIINEVLSFNSNKTLN